MQNGCRQEPLFAVLPPVCFFSIFTGLCPNEEIMFRTNDNNDFDDFRDFDDYRYDNNSRRTVRAENAAKRTKETVRTKTVSSQNFRKGDGPSILYDARGVRMKKSRLSGEFANTLLFFIIPYIVINTIVFILVTASPKIEIKLSGTDDYKTASATFTISSLLPLKETVVTLESETIDYTKDGSTYTAVINKNGTLYVEATGINGMRSTAYTDVSILDDTPPTIDDGSCHIDEGMLSFTVSDAQSGVNWKQIYALDAAGNRITPDPGGIDQKTGKVLIPMASDYLELHVPDMVGNERTASITATVEQLNVSEQTDAEEESV